MISIFAAFALPVALGYAVYSGILAKGKNETRLEASERIGALTLILITVNIVVAFNNNRLMGYTILILSICIATGMAGFGILLGRTLRDKTGEPNSPPPNAEKGV